MENLNPTKEELKNTWSERDNQDSKLLNLVMMAFGVTIIGVFAAAMVVISIQYPQAFSPPSNLATLQGEENQNTESNEDIVDGKDVSSGFVAQGEYLLVKGTCTACHSSKLVTQNRASREGWKAMIVWMQETQKLWDLGQDEDKILDYLAKHYGPEEKGRRAPLEVEEWYRID